MKLGQVMAAGLTAVAVAGIATLALDSSSSKLVAGEVIPDDVRFNESCIPAPLQICDAYETGGKDPSRYRRVEVSATVCTKTKINADGGAEIAGSYVVPAKPRAGIEVVWDSCVAATSVLSTRILDAGVSFVPQACACRRATGTCEYRNKSGTFVTAPLGRTLGPGYPPHEVWQGAGCQPKACSELLGETSWPTACPKG